MNRVAWIDAAYMIQKDHPGAYLLAAVVADGVDVDELLRTSREAAAPGGESWSPAPRRGAAAPTGVLESLLGIVAHHTAWSGLVVHTPIGPQAEHARQTSLHQLLARLNRERVRDVILEARGDERQWRAARSKGLGMPAVNYRDLVTYRDMVNAHHISPRMRLLHRAAHDEPGLWLADAVNWAARRALAMNLLQWWDTIAATTIVVDAVTGARLTVGDNRAALPEGEIGPPSTSQSARTTLLPQQPYPAREPVGNDRVRVTPTLRDVLHQANQARATNPSPGGAVLRSAAALEKAIAHVARQIRESDTRPPGDPLPAEATEDTPTTATPNDEICAPDLS